MKKIILSACAIGAAQTATAQAFAVETVSFNYAKPYPRELRADPFNFRWRPGESAESPTSPKYEVGFLVTGLGIVAIQPESLSIEHIRTRSGKDISRDYRGLRAYTMGNTARIHNENMNVTQDGKNAYFSIQGTSDALPPGEVPQIKGSVTVQYALAADSKTMAFNVAEPFTERVGPFQFSVSWTDDQGGSLDFKLEGDKSNLINLKAEVNGVSYHSNIRSWGDGRARGFPGMNMGGRNENEFGYSIPGRMGADIAKDAEITVTLDYWTELKTRVLPFEARFTPVEEAEDEDE